MGVVDKPCGVMVMNGGGMRDGREEEEELAGHTAI